MHVEVSHTQTKLKSGTNAHTHRKHTHKGKTHTQDTATSTEGHTHTHLHHEVFTEAPAWLGAFLAERAHVVLEAAQVLGERHEQQRAQLEQEGAPRLLGTRRVLQGVRQNHTSEGGREKEREGEKNKEV